MSQKFHEGERAAQARAGVSHMAERVANGIHAAIPPAAQEFLSEQPFAVVGARDGAGRVWASLLSGPPGFLRAEDETTLTVRAVPAPGDPLADLLRDENGGVPVGLLVIEPATRRRMRLNGRAYPLPGGAGLTVRAEQVYANCPKYIQKREVEPGDAEGRGHSPGEAAEAPSEPTDALDAGQRARVAAADTFFIATAHPEAGADASHRGGNPGFVHVSDDGRTLLWPDYSGNAMFNTLGNILASPSAGLLFVDWERGGVLQITGEAEVLWDGPLLRDLPGAERAVSFRVREVRETAAGPLPLHYRLLEYSRFNPA